MKETEEIVKHWCSKTKFKYESLKDIDVRNIYDNLISECCPDNNHWFDCADLCNPVDKKPIESQYRNIKTCHNCWIKSVSEGLK